MTTTTAGRRRQGWIRLLVLLCAVVGSASAVTGCFYTEDLLWQECCILRVYTDETSSPESRTALLKLGAPGYFNGDGVLSIGESHRQKRKIEADFSSFFLDGSAGTRSSDYFTSLGMACSAVSNNKTDLVRCKADLPVWIRCDKVRFVPFGQVPVPNELRQPMPAVLHVSVSLSGFVVLDFHSRVFAVPGGRLCHR